MERDLLRIDPAVTQLVLVGFLRNEITKSSYDQAILSLNGDVDSTVAGFLTVAALGSGSVIALHMPAHDSEQGPSVAVNLIERTLNISCRVMETAPLVDFILGDTRDDPGRRRSDALARARMAILYDQAARHNAIVVGACNKSDLLLGQGTVHGNLATALNPLGDLFRTQVLRLAPHLNIPRELLVNDIEHDLVGAHLGHASSRHTYQQVDPLLHLLFDERYSPEEAAAAGFDSDLIDEVLSQFRGSHAQRALPLIPKLSGRTVGHDLRYLRDSHI